MPSQFDDFIARHVDSPVMGHMRPFIVDLGSVLQNFENHVRNLLAEAKSEVESNTVRLVETRMQLLIEQMTQAFAGLVNMVQEHEVALKKHLEDIAAKVEGDVLGDAEKAAITDIIGKITTMGSTLAAETASLGATVTTAAAAQVNAGAPAAQPAPQPDPTPQQAAQSSDTAPQDAPPQKTG